MRKVNATSGQTIEVFDAPDGSSLAYPHCLPGGRILAVLWTNDRSTNETASVVVVTPKEQVVLAKMDVTSQVDVRWPVLVGSDVVFEWTGSTEGLWALPVNEGITAAEGPPRPVLRNAFRPSTGGGMLTAVTGVHMVDRNLVWVDQHGNNLGSFGKPQREFRSPSLSPKKADEVMTAGRSETTLALWLHSRDMVRKWQDVGGVNGIAWSPDEKLIAYGTVPGNGEKGGVVVRTKVGNEVRMIPNGVRPSWTP